MPIEQVAPTGGQPMQRAPTPPKLKVVPEHYAGDAL